MDEIEQSRRAQQAKELLSDSLLADAFRRLEEKTIERMLSLRNSDDEQRRHCADFVNTIRLVKQMLQAEIDALAVVKANAKQKRLWNSGSGLQS